MPTGYADADPEGFVGGEEWGPPREGVKLNFSLKMACFGEF